MYCHVAEYRVQSTDYVSEKFTWYIVKAVNTKMIDSSEVPKSKRPPYFEMKIFTIKVMPARQIFINMWQSKWVPGQK
jgi:hypothetical protein